MEVKTFNNRNYMYMSSSCSVRFYLSSSSPPAISMAAEAWFWPWEPCGWWCAKILLVQFYLFTRLVCKTHDPPKGAIVLEVPLHEIWVHTTVAIWEKDMVAVIFSAQP